MKRPIRLIGTIILCIDIMSAVAIFWRGLRNNETQHEVIRMMNAVAVFNSDFLREAGDARRLQNVVTVAHDYELARAEIEAHVEGMREAVDALKAKYEKSRKRVKALQKKRHLFYGVIDAGYAGYELGTELLEVSSKWPVMPLDEYILLVDSIDRENVQASRDVLPPKLARLRNGLQRMSDTSASITFKIAAISTLIAFIALTTIFILLLFVFNESNLALSAQDRLQRQESHEMKNSFAPAVSLIETVLEINSTKELENVKPDLSCALSLLRQVEAHHDTRLKSYKLMRGRYQLQMETFEIGAFMKERIVAEELITKAKNPNLLNADRLKFECKLPPSSPENLCIRCDPYILQHVARNFLSNASKHTAEGYISFNFCGYASPLTKDKLVFRVEDTGQGIPDDIAKQLFQTELTTGFDGTGLGLPSCHHFCKAADGYAKLVDTKLADPATGVGGFSIFEFCIAGTISNFEKDSTTSLEDPRDFVQQEDEENRNTQGRIVSHELMPLSHYHLKEQSQIKNFYHALPKKLQVAIIDDSYVNRRVLQVRLQKIAAIHNYEWSFVQFPNVEVGLPYLRESKDDTMNLVTLDNDMTSSGGRMTGTDAIQYLLSIQFSGMMISCSGDPDIGTKHRAIGAHAAWGKPLPPTEQIKLDLIHHFGPLLAPPATPLPQVSTDFSAQAKVEDEHDDLDHARLYSEYTLEVH